MDIDISRFEELSDGDPAGVLELVQLYLTKTTEQILELEKALNAQLLPQAARIAHSLVGANAMVGIQVLVPLLRDLEEQAEKGNAERARTIFEQVSRTFKDVHSTLTKLTETQTQK